MYSQGGLALCFVIPSALFSHFCVALQGVVPLGGSGCVPIPVRDNTNDSCNDQRQEVIRANYINSSPILLQFMTTKFRYDTDHVIFGVATID